MYQSRYLSFAALVLLQHHMCLLLDVNVGINFYKQNNNLPTFVATKTKQPSIALHWPFDTKNSFVNI